MIHEINKIPNSIKICNQDLIELYSIVWLKMNTKMCFGWQRKKGNILGLEKAKWGHQLSSTRGDNPTWPQHLPRWIGSRKKLHSIFGVIYFFFSSFFGFFRQIIPTTGVLNYVLDDYFNWKTMPLKKNKLCWYGTKR